VAVIGWGSFESLDGLGATFGGGDHQQSGAVLDGFYCCAATAGRWVQVDRAAGVAVLCGLHVSYSLVRGVRGKRYKFVSIQSILICIDFLLATKKPAHVRAWTLSNVLENF
jgi:hypothetical protein